MGGFWLGCSVVGIGVLLVGWPLLSKLFVGLGGFVGGVGSGLRGVVTEPEPDADEKAFLIGRKQFQALVANGHDRGKAADVTFAGMRPALVPPAAPATGATTP